MVVVIVVVVLGRAGDGVVAVEVLMITIVMLVENSAKKHLSTFF